MVVAEACILNDAVLADSAVVCKIETLKTVCVALLAGIRCIVVDLIISRTHQLALL